MQQSPLTDVQLKLLREAILNFKEIIPSVKFFHNILAFFNYKTDSFKKLIQKYHSLNSRIIMVQWWLSIRDLNELQQKQIDNLLPEALNIQENYIHLLKYK